MNAEFIMIVTACPNRQEADRLSRALVDQRLAACVQASTITSRYRWRGTIETEDEIRLLIKTKASCFEQISKTITALLSYENPEILVLRFINNLNKSITSYMVGSSCMLEESHGYWTTKSTAGACR